MKRIIIGISVATLTFLMGLAVTGTWAYLHDPPPFVCKFPIQPKPFRATVDGRGLPCLLGAVNTVDEVNRLLDAGEDVNGSADGCIQMYPSPSGVTLLMKAAAAGNREMV